MTNLLKTKNEEVVFSILRPTPFQFSWTTWAIMRNYSKIIQLDSYFFSRTIFPASRQETLNSSPCLNP